MGHPEDERMLRRCTVSVEEITGNQFAPERFAAVLKRWLESVFPASGEGRYSMGADFFVNE